MAKCAHCQAGPAGIEGHDQLFSYSMSGSQFRFKCHACDTLWVRRYAGEGGFSWSVAAGDEAPGMELPGRHAPRGE